MLKKTDVSMDEFIIEAFMKLSDKAERKTGRKQAIVDLLRERGVALTTKAIAEAIGSNPAGVNTICRDLQDEGLLTRKFQGNVGYWVLTELLES